MDQATLVSLDVERGQQVVERLQAEGIEPKVALWIVTPEFEDGRLVVASPKLDQTDRLKAYETVFKALRRNYTGQLPSLLLLPMKDRFIRSLRDLFARTKDVAGMRLGGQTIGDRFLSEAYVYRIR